MIKFSSSTHELGVIESNQIEENNDQWVNIDQNNLDISFSKPSPL